MTESGLGLCIIRQHSLAECYTVITGLGLYRRGVSKVVPHVQDTKRCPKNSHLNLIYLDEIAPLTLLGRMATVPYHTFTKGGKTV